ncbi:MAG: PAS domain S-box protein [Nodosilinea sp. WJT8-NPBG4]|jgi:PAS domain S-box-containing protein|nr:PAS domain S-box protein [Nodosilinea sp. WJT8-NPBG4]
MNPNSSETILSRISDAFVALDQDCRFTYVNDRYCEIVDTERDALLGQIVWELFPETADSEVHRQFQRALSEQTPVVFEWLFAAWNRWFEYRVYPSPDGLTIFLTEISDRKQTEMALRQSEARFRRIFECNMVPMGIWSRSGGVLQANDALLDLIGYTRQEMEAEQISWLTITPPEWLSQDEASLAEIAAEGFSTPFEKKYIHKQGHRVPILIAGASFLDDPDTGIFFALDLTERKATEAILQQAADLSAFRVSLTDLLRPLADPIAVQAIASRLLGEYLGANRVAYFEVRDADYVVERDYVNGATALVGKYPIDSFGQELLAAYRTGQPVCVADVATDLNLTIDQQSAYATMQIKAYIGIPLIKHGEFVAGLAVHTVSPRAWTPDEVALAQEVAERIWSAIERAQIEANLRRSEAEFRIISNAAPALVWVGAQDGSITFFNDRWYEFTGQTEAEAIGFGWANATHADDLARILPYWEHCRQTGEPYEGEIRYRRHDGEYYWYVFRALPRRNRAGEVEAWYGLSIDISERKQAAAEREQLLQQEQTLRQQAEIAERGLYTLLASIREDFLSFDHDWRVTYLNPQAEITMQRPRDQILGHRIWELFPDLVGTEYYHRLHQVMREQAPVQFEYYYDTWDVWFDNRVYPSPEGITILCTNITNRKRAEAEREQLLAREQAAREAAEAASRIKDEFLAVVSHELRSPLNPILGWAKLLRTRQLDAEKTERALEVIERNAQMQAQLINDLLDVSRILRGKLSLETKPVNLAATIQAAMETVRLAAEAKSIDLRFTICDFGLERDNNPKSQIQNPKLQVMGDSGRLQQVVWNLLTNAVKFTAEGGRVEVWLEQEGGDRGADSSSPYHPSHARITVTDTGKGISSDFLPYVFEQFRQESSATTRRFGGLGLGLAIVRYLVELHGGTIQADSPGDGQGATFTVRLPLMPHQPVAKPDPAPSKASIDLRGTRILVVDDDDNTREFLAFLLELHGANVLATATADEAIATLTQFMPEVLLSDIGMPDVDGYMLLRQIRALPAEQGGTVPAIALTAYAGEIDYRQAMAAGFQRHMAKPLEPQALIQAIASLLKQSAAT